MEVELIKRGKEAEWKLTGFTRLFRFIWWSA
jgi:hypothetical protein